MGSNRKKIIESTLTQAELIEKLYYDTDTGLFYAKVPRGKVKIGQLVGWTKSGGYRIICLDGICYRAHRLAWFYTYGVWPSEDLDHRDGNTSNNRIINLREATDSQNLGNMKKPITNRSGRKGVSWHKGGKKWQVHIMVEGDNKYLGLYSDLNEAHRVYVQAAQEYRGEFGRAG